MFSRFIKYIYTDSFINQRCVLIFVFVLMISCDKNRIFERNISIDNNIWSLAQKPHFEHENKDTLSSVNIMINVRHSTKYPFSNLWLFVNTTCPDGYISQDTLECLLAEKSGRWIGNGIGNIRDVSFFLKQTRLKKEGLYLFSIEQAMRHGDLTQIDSLNGVVGIGLRIENSRNE